MASDLITTCPTCAAPLARHYDLGLRYTHLLCTTVACRDSLRRWVLLADRDRVALTAEQEAALQALPPYHRALLRPWPRE